MELYLMSLITLASFNHEIDPRLMLSLCFQESGFTDVTTLHDGHSKSYGACQVKEVASLQVGLTRQAVHSTEGSIDVAVRYMKYNLQRCRGSVDCALTGYNSGKLSHKRSKYSEKVMSTYWRF